MGRLTYLVGHDGSHRAGDALAFAASLARATGGRLLLVRVRDAQRPATDAGDARLLSELAHEAAPGIDVGVRVVESRSAVRALQRVAVAEGAALVVVGASRRLDEMPGGEGVGVGLLRGARCPVAVVPAGWTERSAGHRPVVCAFGDCASSRPALSAARALASDLDLPLRVLGVPEHPGANGRAAQRILADAVARCYPGLDADIAVAQDGQPGEVLADVSADAEILVTGARAYGVDTGLFDPSISRHLIRHAACPVVVVPFGARPAPPAARVPTPAEVAADPGLVDAAGVSLLTDQYELTMAASYLRRGMNEPAVFELFVRELPGDRRWLLTAGLGPALSLVRDLRFGGEELAYLERQGFGDELLAYLEAFRFSGDVDAMPEGTVAFAGEPLVRVTAPRIEAQLLETLLLNQINFQTAIATKAARIALAAGGGRASGGARVVDFSPRRDHGIDAAMKAARCARIAGAEGTSCMAAAMRYGLRPVGTMAHSYVLSFASEEESFRAFLEDNPSNAVLLVDTFDTLAGVANAISASRATGVPLMGVRLDSGDLLTLSREARRLLDAAGMGAARIVASGDLEERQIARLVAAGAPIDTFGVGTDLGTSRDAPALGGVYKLVADQPAGWAGWRPTAKRSAGKATLPWPKQVFRRHAGGVMAGDTVTRADRTAPGIPLLVPAMRGGTVVLAEPLETIRERAARSLDALPAALRLADAAAPGYPVDFPGDGAGVTEPLQSA
jgi:nicotinate phosphoribosyltransferase